MAKASENTLKYTTIYDIANMAGVSIATVSRVLNGSANVSAKSKAKVQSAIDQSGYIPSSLAQGLSWRRTGIVGIVVPVISDINHAKIVSELEMQLLKLGYNSLISCTNLREDKRNQYLHLLASKSVDGIIVVGSFTSDLDAAADFAAVQPRVPIVVVGGLVNEVGVPSVYADDYGAIRSLATELLEKGYHSLVYLNDSVTFTGTQKLKGFNDALASTSPQGQGLTLFVKQRDDIINAACEAISSLIESGASLSGIMAADDSLAIGALKALRKRNMEMPVIGYNNTRYARGATPELSSIDNDYPLMCKTAVEILGKLLNGETVSENVIIPTHLAERETYKR